MVLLDEQAGAVVRGADPGGPGGSHTQAHPPPCAQSSLSGPQRAPQPYTGRARTAPSASQPPPALGPQVASCPSRLQWPEGAVHLGQPAISLSHPPLSWAGPPGPRKGGSLAQVGLLQPLHPPSLRVGSGTVFPQLCASAALYPPCPEPAWPPGLQPDPNPLGRTALRASLFQRQCQNKSGGPGEGLPQAPPRFCNSSWGHRAPDLLTTHLGRDTWAAPPQPREELWETSRTNKAPEPPAPPPACGGSWGDSAR